VENDVGSDRLGKVPTELCVRRRHSVIECWKDTFDMDGGILGRGCTVFQVLGSLISLSSIVSNQAP
jgi:hypothetical protein